MDNNELLNYVNDIIKKNYKDYNSIGKLLDKVLVSSSNEKKNYAEFSTPWQLRKDMLNKIPLEFWKNPNNKILEPCCGKGLFVLDIFLMFDNGLKEYEPNDDKRYKHIIENCIYFCDINSTNVYITSSILSSFNNNYTLNSWCGNTLKLDIIEVWNINEFDAIIGNPPYNDASGNTGKYHTLWDKFIIKSLNILKNNGYLLFINPSGWRAPKGIFRHVFDTFMKQTLIYLNMNNYKTGRRVFHAATCFDYYLLQKKPKELNHKTIINDIDNNIYEINLSDWCFIPSGCFNEIKELLSKNNDNKCKVLHSHYYGSDKKRISKKKTNVFKYPCCYTITIKNGLKCLYSSIKKEHFGISKIIWSNGTGTYPIVDMNGDYGLSQYAYAIVDDKENLENIKIALNNKKLINLMKYARFTSNKYNHKVFELFRRDFWKDFI